MLIVWWALFCWPTGICHVFQNHLTVVHYLAIIIETGKNGCSMLPVSGKTLLVEELNDHQEPD